MYKKIVNCQTGRKVNIHSKLGQKILKKYIQMSNNLLGGAVKSNNLLGGGNLKLEENEFKFLDNVVLYLQQINYDAKILESIFVIFQKNISENLDINELVELEKKLDTIFKYILLKREHRVSLYNQFGYDFEFHIKKYSEIIREKISELIQKEKNLIQKKKDIDFIDAVLDAYIDENWKDGRVEAITIFNGLLTYEKLSKDELITFKGKFLYFFNNREGLKQFLAAKEIDENYISDIVNRIAEYMEQLIHGRKEKISP